jgi:pimeloyl-ACP methyl ester carboxylesterase
MRARLADAFPLALGLCAMGLALGLPPSPAGATQPRPDRAGTIWLCRPGQADDPCRASLTTTVIDRDGHSHVVDYSPASSPPIDCFYVYPNVTLQRRTNATLHIDPQETALAELEASPFSRDCRVFAPMYRLDTGLSPRSTKAQDIDQRDVVKAWDDYLAHDNDGRGVVLIGHSAGAFALSRLIEDHIDRNPAVRRLLVSALLIGTNTLIGVSGHTGHTGHTGHVSLDPYEHIACRAADQIGCVISYNAFARTPPSDTLFGRPDPAVFDGVRQEVLCTNPAALAGGDRSLVSLYRTHLPTQQVAGSVVEGIFGSHPPSSSTPWIEYDGHDAARCVTRHGATVLLVTPTKKGAAPLASYPNASFGLHVDDLNLALGNLVAAEARTFVRPSQHQSQRRRSSQPTRMAITRGSARSQCPAP